MVFWRVFQAPNLGAKDGSVISPPNSPHLTGVRWSTENPRLRALPGQVASYSPANPAASEAIVSLLSLNQVSMSIASEPAVNRHPFREEISYS